MDQRWKFSKLHALGNDFILIDELETRGARRWGQPGLEEVEAQRAIELCDRRRGVGADQILVLQSVVANAAAGRFVGREVDAVVRLLIWNADGSRAQMCGNGLRAVGEYLSRVRGGTAFAVMTDAGARRVERVEGVWRAEMRVGIEASSREPMRVRKLKIGRTLYPYYGVDLGNPHAVIFTNRVDRVPLEKLGSQVERHQDFSERTNVEFVEVVSAGGGRGSQIRVRVWERGAGATLACGSGACAAAIAAVHAKQCEFPVRVQMPGGELAVELGRQSTDPWIQLWLIGPVSWVYEGQRDEKGSRAVD